MKTLLLCLAVGTFGWSTAFAGSPHTTPGPVSGGSETTPVATSTSTNGQQQQQSSTANSSSNNAGNSQSITFTTPANTTSAQTVAVTSTGTEAVTTNGSTSSDNTVRNVPNVNAPPLVSSNDTCMGSASAGLGIVGTGISFGKTYEDKNCIMLKNSRELWNMGMRGAAMARMCMDKLNREALEMTGFVCPQTEREKANKK